MPNPEFGLSPEEMGIKPEEMEIKPEEGRKDPESQAEQGGSERGGTEPEKSEKEIRVEQALNRANELIQICEKRLEDYKAEKAEIGPEVTRLGAEAPKHLRDRYELVTQQVTNNAELLERFARMKRVLGLGSEGVPGAPPYRQEMEKLFNQFSK